MMMRLLASRGSDSFIGLLLLLGCLLQVSRGSNEGMRRGAQSHEAWLAPAVGDSGEINIGEEQTDVAAKPSQFLRPGMCVQIGHRGSFCGSDAEDPSSPGASCTSKVPKTFYVVDAGNGFVALFAGTQAYKGEPFPILVFVDA